MFAFTREPSSSVVKIAPAKGPAAAGAALNTRTETAAIEYQALLLKLVVALDKVVAPTSPCKSKPPC